jgi:hypothetical protein
LPYSLPDSPIDSKSKTIVDVKSSTKGKRPKMTGHFLYVFLGEGGNFDFTAGGTPYFLFSSIAKERPFAAYQDMTELKYDLIETGANIEYFHAAEDRCRIACPDFPLAAAAWGPLRSKAETAGSGDFTPLWSGQAARFARELPAAELTKRLAAEAIETLRTL